MLLDEMRVDAPPQWLIRDVSAAKLEAFIRKLRFGLAERALTSKSTAAHPCVRTPRPAPEEPLFWGKGTSFRPASRPPKNLSQRARG
jgi:hypothetical protein